MYSRIILNPDNRLLGWSTADLSAYGGQTDPQLTISWRGSEAPADTLQPEPIRADSAPAHAQSSVVSPPNAPLGDSGPAPILTGLTSAGPSPAPVHAPAVTIAHPTAAPDAAAPVSSIAAPAGHLLPSDGAVVTAALSGNHGAPAILADVGTAFGAPLLEGLGGGLPATSLIGAPLAAGIFGELAQAEQRVADLTTSLLPQIGAPPIDGIGVDAVGAIPAILSTTLDATLANTEPVHTALENGLGDLLSHVDALAGSIVAPADALAQATGPAASAPVGTAAETIVQPGLDAVAALVQPAAAAIETGLGAAQAPIDSLAGAVANPVTATIADTAAPVEAAVQPVADAALGGTDPAAGVATLVSLVSTADAFDLRAPGTGDSHIEPAASVLDSLAGELVPADALLGDAHHDDGLIGTLDTDHHIDLPLGL
jgi:hypothetical protein